MKILIIIPTYNEIENIENLINTIFSLHNDFTILVIDDGSPDGTAQKVMELKQQLFNDRLFIECRPCKMGLGTAYIKGFQWGLERDYDYYFEIDADFSHNPNDLIRLLDKACNEQFDVVVGSRYVKGGSIEGWPWERKFYSFGGSLFARIITWIPIKDTTAGFVCYRKSVLQKMNLNSIQQKGYGFQIEMKFLAWKLGFKLTEIPILFKDRILGTSKMSSKIIFEAFFNVLKMQYAYLMGKYLKEKSHE
ncbi:MAG: polyprenol monophosphomannose synthase [Sediminibacterium sp.]|nr:polyprenol monophosphomannose synthase [Sediminibacterium sp.]